MKGTEGSRPCPPRAPGRTATAWLSAVLLLSTAAAAQTKPATRPVMLPAQSIQAQIARLAQLKDLDPPVRTKAVETYKQALAQLQISENWQGKAVAFDAAAKEAPTRLAAVKKQLASPASQPAAPPPEATVAQLDAMLAKASAELSSAKAALADLEAEPKRRADRRMAIPRLIAAARKSLDETDKALSEAPPKGLHPELAEATRTLLGAQKEALRREMEACRKELASYDAERPLLTARRDLTVRQVSGAEKLAKGLEEIRDRKQKEEAERRAREAKDVAARVARSDPAIRELADGNARLAAQRTGPKGLPSRIQAVSQQLEDVNAARSRLRQDFLRLSEKAKAIEKTATFGVLLRKQRSELPDVRQFHRLAEARQAEVSDVQLRLIELEDARSALADLDAKVQQIVAGLDPSLSEARQKDIADIARLLLEDRRKHLDALIKDHDTYFARLIDLEASARLLLVKAQDVAAYIDERVLWIRSGSLLGFRHVTRAAEASRWLFGAKTWAAAAEALADDLRENPIGVATGLLAFALLLAFRRRLSRRLAAIGQPGARGAGGTVLPTMAAVVLALLLAGTVPAFVWFVAWRLSSSPIASDPVKAVSAGLLTVAAVLAAFGLLSEMLRPDGLAASYFDWPVQRRAFLRRSLGALAVVLALLGLVVSSVEWQGNEAWKNALGRLALIAALLVLALFALRLLRPSGPLLAEALARAKEGWLFRLRHLWHPALVAAPVVLALLAVMGFYFTALHLTGRLAVTFWWVIALVLLHAVARRWVDGLIRNLAARRRRRIVSRARADAAPDEVGQQDDESEQADRLDTTRGKARQLLRYVMAIALIVGTWRIWSDSLPALAALRRVELWTHTVKTTRQVVSTDGTTAGQTVESIVPVTLADAVLTVLVVVLTVVAVRDLPGILEMAVLQRTRMDAGARYAVKAIVTYALAVTGIILAFQTIGVGWSSVQWLVAAMTVGLGFGLQEIFANFVSGLIILFERPIRIGDTVTVGETAGTVTRIRIRATTITDWDRKELIVPNKEFVTGRLVNWTLSDKVLRVVLRVGIAYGSDTELAEKVLYEEAKKSRLVLSDPQPVVLFSAFGDNSLNFELRVYISGIRHYLKVWHDLNMAIDRAFREHGITVAFPQRDTHLDTLKPLEVRIVSAEEARGGREPSKAEPADRES